MLSCFSALLVQAHIQLDRSSKHGADQPPGVAVVSAGTYLCTLCQYRTSLKANFQLHCKTDKHLQRLALVVHVQEGRGGAGGAPGCLAAGVLPASAVDVWCSACEYRTNSVYRLQMHAAGAAHAARAALYRFLAALEARSGPPRGGRRYRCLACGVTLGSRFATVRNGPVTVYFELVLDSGAEGPGFRLQPRRCQVAVLGKLFTPIVIVPPFTK